MGTEKGLPGAVGPRRAVGRPAPDGPAGPGRGRPRCLYLHGFASSPGSKKAVFFRERLERLGFEMVVPDLNEGDFEHLTITRILSLVRRVVDGWPSEVPRLLVGSSLGGYVTALHLADGGRADAAVLLAPAFQPPERWRHFMDADDLDEWAIRGVRDFEHYGYGHPEPLRYTFFEDAMTHEPWPSCDSVPTLIIQGRLDETVPVGTAVEYQRRHPRAQLEVLETDHGMEDALEAIWERTEAFLETVRAFTALR